MPGHTACYRCGYDLHGLADESACPECGLLVRHSRPRDHTLTEANPRWLTSMLWGVWLLLAALLIACLWPNVRRIVGWDWFTAEKEFWSPQRRSICFCLGWDVTAGLLIVAGFLLTRSEGDVNADRESHRCRTLIRIAVFLPALAILWEHLDVLGRVPRLWWMNDAYYTLAYAPLPLLGFWYFGGLLRRFGRGRLARQCLFAGLGGSAALVGQYLCFTVFDIRFPSTLDAPGVPVWLAVVGFATVFWLWALYLAVRFGLMLWAASFEIGVRWRNE